MRLGFSSSFLSAQLVLAVGVCAQTLLYDNGPIVTHPGGGAGGADASALDNTPAFHPPHNVYGFGSQYPPTGNNSLADDFTVCGTWTVTALEFFVYQTNGVPPLITGAYAQVWDRDPRVAGATVIRGDLVTNLITAPPVGAFFCYRVLIGDLASSSRAVATIRVSVNWAPLPPGVYWLGVRATGRNVHHRTPNLIARGRPETRDATLGGCRFV